MSYPMGPGDETPMPLRWARLRFSIVGPLLASPPKWGELAGRIDALAAMTWKHPATGKELHYKAKTIEKMYYAVRGEADPFHALARKVPKHAGTHPSVSEALAKAIAKQYDEHRSWSYKLQYDNLVVVAKEDVSLRPMPVYATVRRFMKDCGMVPNRKRRGKGSPTEAVARETRSYEVAHVNALWHYDFHVGRRQVLTASGEWKTPYLFGVLDDCSRVCCHAQWYLERENTANLVHGLCQGFRSASCRGRRSATGVVRCEPKRTSKVMRGSLFFSISRWRTALSRMPNRSTSGPWSRAASCPCSKESPI